jgi:hypothetical protein
MTKRQKITAILIAFALLGGLVLIANSLGWTTRIREQATEPSQNSPSEEPEKNKLLTIAFDPRSAEIPSLCGHPAGRLSQGEAPSSSGGGTSARKNAVGEIMVGVDERPDDFEAVAVLALTCNKGGVGWPDTVAVYDRTSKLLGHVTLDSLTKGNREQVLSVGISDGIARASWTTGGKGDPDCCGTVTASASFQLIDSVFTAGEVSHVSEETALEAFLDALNRGDDATAATYADDEVVRKFSSLRAAEGPIYPVACYGLLNSTEIPDHLLDSLNLDSSGNINLPSSSGIRRYCTVSNEAGRMFVFGWGTNDGGGWIIRFISS